MRYSISAWTLGLAVAAAESVGAVLMALMLREWWAAAWVGVPTLGLVAGAYWWLLPARSPPLGGAS